MVLTAVLSRMSYVPLRPPPRRAAVGMTAVADFPLQLEELQDKMSSG